MTVAGTGRWYCVPYGNLSAKDLELNVPQATMTGTGRWYCVPYENLSARDLELNVPRATMTDGLQ